MSPVAINGIDKQGVYVNGVQVKQALNAANETVAKGVFDETTLSAVDADLQVGNIKLAENIFGFVGTLLPGGVETFDKYADAKIADDATYTIATSGIFVSSTIGIWESQYYSTDDTTWYRSSGGDTDMNLIADGTNVLIKNLSGGNAEYCIFRHVFTTGTYERYRDAAIAQGASFTPSDSGFYQGGIVDGGVIRHDVNYTIDGWQIVNQYTTTMIRLLLSDGTNLRFRENGVAPGQLIIFRAVMT